MDKRRLILPFQKYVANPLTRTAFGSRLLGRYAVLETTGRRSGEPRRVPVGIGIEGETAWIVVEHGRRAAYVRNIEANPHVRLRVRGRWRSGTAHVMPDDDPRARQRLMPRLNAFGVRAFGDELLTVRIDLDPA